LPTVDLWDVGELNPNPNKYEYTPNFIWGNTVHQASAACYDYFKWGEYLQPTRNDFAELGWNDRNYYGAAMSASIGVINKIPNSYPAFWGMPQKVKERKGAINDAYGGRPKSKSIDIITGHIHRDVDVLLLYPMNLVAAEERFGSWIAQYGYANYITAEKLLELAKINDKGEILIKDKKYTTLVALFEPIPQKGVLNLMEKLTKRGGRSIWFGPPPILNGNGERCLEKWERIFGVEYRSSSLQGIIAAGKKIEFKEIPSQYILTEFVIDHIYPVEVLAGTSKLAFCDNDLLVGTGNSNAYYFGFRPRDDQSASLGYETRTLFEVLDKVGAYQSSGTFPGENDNTEHISRTSDYLTTRFPNNSTVIVRHYRTHKETWPGGFSRNEEVDRKVLAENPLPTDTIMLRDFKVNGHEFTFDGRLTMAFRMNEMNELIAFEGQNCNRVEIDDNAYQFSESPLQKIAFAPSLENPENEIKIFVSDEATVSIPPPAESDFKPIEIKDEGGRRVKYRIENKSVIIEIDTHLKNKWLTLFK